MNSISIYRSVSMRGLALGTSLLCTLLAGCTLQTTATPSPLQGNTFGGKLMGGQQPVSGATVYILQTSTSGYGNGVLGGGVLATTTSDASGNFNFPAATYTCPSPNSQILLEARGGNPGLAAGTNNSAIFLVAALGPCSGVTPTTFVIVNEVTTVAAAYALRPFLIQSPTTGVINSNNVGTSSTNAVGLANAVVTYNNLVDNGKGTSPGAAVPAGAAIPSTTIHSLANSLAVCVNTSDATSTACQNLFSYAQSATSGTTGNVFVAAANIASHPAVSASNVYFLATANPPFQPSLAAAPGDWTLPIVYTSGNLKSIHVALDVDQTGNVFVLTKGGSSGTVEELANSGTFVKGNLLNNLIDGPTGLAIDTLGRIAVSSATPGNPSVLLMDNSGALVTFYNDTSNFIAPSGVAFDATNNLVVTDTGSNKIFQLTPSLGGNPATLTRTVAYIGGPTNPAIDGSGNLWISSNTVNQIDRFAGGLAGARGTFTSGNAVSQGAFSFDSAGLAYSCGNSSDIFSYTNTSTPSYNYYQSGSAVARGIRVDGTGGSWCALGPNSERSRMFHAIANFGTSFSVGLKVPYVPNSPAGVAIDRSGNVWYASATANVGLTQYVGAASPVVTPVANNSAGNTFGTRP